MGTSPVSVIQAECNKSTNRYYELQLTNNVHVLVREDRPHRRCAKLAVSRWHAACMTWMT